MKKAIVAGAVALLALYPIPAAAQLSSGSSFPGSSAIVVPEPPQPEPEPEYIPRYDGERVRVADQGDRIWGTIQDADGYVSGCTAGYVNRAEREVWTSDHCYKLGEDVTVDGVVFGTVTKEGGDTGGVSRARDWAIITLTAEAAVGLNGHSGDRIDHNPQEGDPISMYGATTQEQIDATIKEVYRDGHVSYCPARATQGDSGGPVWSADGLVGLHSGRGGVPPCDGSQTGYAALATNVK